MPKRSGKAPSSDPDRAGFEIVEQDTADEAEILRDIEESTKNLAAVARGRKGGADAATAKRSCPETRQGAVEQEGPLMRSSSG